MEMFGFICCCTLNTSLNYFKGCIVAIKTSSKEQYTQLEDMRSQYFFEVKMRSEFELIGVQVLIIGNGLGLDVNRL